MLQTDYDIVVIGGGAAGFFAAIHAAKGAKQKVVLLEKTNKLLSKVKVSGGGRCNVTHDCDYAAQLINHYPRGGRSLRKPFEIFGTQQTREWFEKRGVKLKVEEDGRIFPTTDDSQTIINCLFAEAKRNDVTIELKSEVTKITRKEEGFSLKLKSGAHINCKKVIVTTGGQNKASGYDWLKQLGLKIERPIPSLFTFNVPDSDLKDLLGLSVGKGYVQIPGTKWKQDGPILITHWGFSAPAVIKLSAWAAIDLFDKSYQFPILINWTGLDEEATRTVVNDYKKQHPKKVVSTNQLLEIPSRLWLRICQKAEIEEDKRYVDLSKKQFNKLIEMLVRCPFQVNGKTTFKEEFVTCGGVNLKEVDLKTFEAKKIPGLYLAGEVLNVDGVTGGFNFQHAWTSGYLSGTSAAQG
ncbi:NAD(P)/FAD-dependent oxidoreductase [Owenweeksia hongkongensis]|uniref:NAD(P)/FAD-dependent oxidoreductase n=1 Tax=Owenweeksia hongkongensis TaxID=253245 RepID=UPI003A8F9124